MSLASSVVLAYVAAVPFGAAGAAALIASVTYLQEALAGERRVLGLTVFHVALRIGMSVGAIGGGLLAQVLAPGCLPLVGTVRPPALVLFGAGVAMVAGAVLMPGTTISCAGTQGVRECGVVGGDLGGQQRNPFGLVHPYLAPP